MVTVMYSSLSQEEFYNGESKISVLVTVQKISFWIPMQTDLGVLVLVSVHPKLGSFV